MMSVYMEVYYKGYFLMRIQSKLVISCVHVHPNIVLFNDFNLTLLTRTKYNNAN